MFSLELAEGEYECDQCGACCKNLIVEIEDEDIEREPRLAELARHRYKLASIGSPCKALDCSNRCSLYATRPDVCRDFDAGSEACQDSRRRANLPPLRPIDRMSRTPLDLVRVK